MAQLGAAYKQLNAPFGALGMASLRVATTGIVSSSPGDARYLATDARLGAWAARRDALAAEIAATLDGTEFGGHPVGRGRAHQLTEQARRLVGEVVEAAP